MDGPVVVSKRGQGLVRAFRSIRADAYTNMSQHRLYIETGLESGSNVTLDAERSHYLLRVLRMRRGQSLIVFNGDGREYEASLASVQKHGAELEIAERREPRTESALKIHLVQGVSRGDRMDWVVQKATELGVKRISPVLTDLGIVRLEHRRAQRRLKHWRKVAIGATEQSGRTRPPLIDPPVPLRAWLGAGPRESDRDLILRPGASEPLLQIAPPRTKLCLLVGPEGGFADTEYGAAAAAEFQEVSLGPRILRTETAAVAALAVAQSAWGDLKNA